MAPVTAPIRYPRTSTDGYTPRQVANAYGAPAGTDGTGTTIGVIELGGAFNPSDFTALGLDPDRVKCINVDGGAQASDGPDGADGEVMLDLEIIASVAPGAELRVYFADNQSDDSFLNAITQAGSECQVISISWGSAESQWDPSSLKRFAAAFATLRAHGVTVFAAAGDNGADDGTGSAVVDYPAADPNVVGCGGTRLTLSAAGQRLSEVVWDDDSQQSATGGGVSRVFPGRQVPDIAGNADPVTGYRIVVDGQSAVAGGTSAMAPLSAAMLALIRQKAAGQAFDLLNTVLTNPGVCYDVTKGNNGQYKAGPGRDDVSGFGVIDWSKLLTVLTSGRQVPAPGGTTSGTATGSGTTPAPTTGGTGTVTTNQPGNPTGTGTSTGTPSAPVAGGSSGSTGPSVGVLDSIEHEIEEGLSAVVGAVRKLKSALGG